MGTPGFALQVSFTHPGSSRASISILCFIGHGRYSCLELGPFVPFRLLKPLLGRTRECAYGVLVTVSPHRASATLRPGPPRGCALWTCGRLFRADSDADRSRSPPNAHRGGATLTGCSVPVPPCSTGCTAPALRGRISLAIRTKRGSISAPPRTGTPGAFFYDRVGALSDSMRAAGGGGAGLLTPGSRSPPGARAGA